MSLNPKQERFCQEYIIDLNATQAAIRAGYSEKTANEQGARLLVNVSAQEYIQELMQKRSDRTEITADKVLQELASIGFAKIEDFVNVIEIEQEKQVFGEDPNESFEPEIIKIKVVDIIPTRNIPKNKLGAIAGIKQGKDGIEVKLHDKVKTLELMGRHLGIFEKDNSQRKQDTNIIIPEQVSKAIDKLLDDSI